MMASDELCSSPCVALRRVALSGFAAVLLSGSGCQLDSSVTRMTTTAGQPQTGAGKPGQSVPDAETPYSRPDSGDGDADAGSAVGGADAGSAVGGADACKVDHGGCDVLAPCQSVQGHAKCGPCPQGYEDSHGDGTACRDIDECTVDRGGCDQQHGSCVNTPGKRECRCQDGFHGDGFHCSTNVLCTRDTDCTADARCADQSGLRVCICKAGYEGDGASCRDVDECALGTDDCSVAPRACVNSVGSFECKCPQGSSGSGHGAMGCLDRNECADNSDDCSSTPDACVNDAPGFHCACPKGFTGRGQGPDSCRDIDECATQTHDCKAPQACVNDAPGFHCGCPPGYRSDSRGAGGCVDIDECAMGTVTCDPMRPCVNEPGSAHCGECPAGSQPNGSTGCGTCACYEQSADQACSSVRASEPEAATRVLGDDRNLDAGSLFGMQVRLPVGAHVTGFGAIKSGDETPRISMGLYTDAGGVPGTLVTRSMARAFTNQRITLPVQQEDAACLAAGTYWLLALVNDDLTLGAAEAGPQVPFARVKVDGQGVQLPARWPADGDIDDARMLNLYVSFDHP